MKKIIDTFKCVNTLLYKTFFFSLFIYYFINLHILKGEENYLFNNIAFLFLNFKNQIGLFFILYTPVIVYWLLSIFYQQTKIRKYFKYSLIVFSVLYLFLIFSVFYKRIFMMEYSHFLLFYLIIIMPYVIAFFSFENKYLQKNCLITEKIKSTVIASIIFVSIFVFVEEWSFTILSSTIKKHKKIYKECIISKNNKCVSNYVWRARNFLHLGLKFDYFESNFLFYIFSFGCEYDLNNEEKTLSCMKSRYDSLDAETKENISMQFSFIYNEENNQTNIMNTEFMSFLPKAYAKLSKTPVAYRMSFLIKKYDELYQRFILNNETTYYGFKPFNPYLYDCYNGFNSCDKLIEKDLNDVKGIDYFLIADKMHKFYDKINYTYDENIGKLYVKACEKNNNLCLKSAEQLSKIYQKTNEDFFLIKASNAYEIDCKKNDNLESCKRKINILYKK